MAIFSSPVPKSCGNQTGVGPVLVLLQDGRHAAQVGQPMAAHRGRVRTQGPFQPVAVLPLRVMALPLRRMRLWSGTKSMCRNSSSIRMHDWFTSATTLKITVRGRNPMTSSSLPGPLARHVLEGALVRPTRR